MNRDPDIYTPAVSRAWPKTEAIDNCGSAKTILREELTTCSVARLYRAGKAEAAHEKRPVIARAL